MRRRSKVLVVAPVMIAGIALVWSSRDQQSSGVGWPFGWLLVVLTVLTFGFLIPPVSRRMVAVLDMADKATEKATGTFLEFVASLCFVFVALLGGVFIYVAINEPNSSGTWFLGILLLIAGVAGIYLLTPQGVARYGQDRVRRWYQGSAGIASAIALAYLNGAASVTDPAKANADMNSMAGAAVVAFVAALLALRQPKPRSEESGIQQTRPNDDLR